MFNWAKARTEQVPMRKTACLGMPNVLNLSSRNWLLVTGSLWFSFPAAFIKGLLLSESAPAWLSAAKSTIPSVLRGQRLCGRAGGSAVPALGSTGWNPLLPLPCSSSLCHWPGGAVTQLCWSSLAGSGCSDTFFLVNESAMNDLTVFC